MAANRKDGMAGAVSRIWGRGGVFGCMFDRGRTQCGSVLTRLHSLPRSHSLGLD